MHIFGGIPQDATVTSTLLSLMPSSATLLQAGLIF